MKGMSRFVLTVCLLLMATPASTWAQSAGTPAPEPIISEELMARLIQRTLASEKEAVLSAGICAIFSMCDGTSDMPAKQIVNTQADGKYAFFVPLREGSTDIIVAVKHASGEPPSGVVIDSYLTDKNGNLRAAAISELPGPGHRLITNEQAAENFTAVMQFLATLAEELPPVGAAADDPH
ncbi:MAG: hypothetical protein V1796_01565 [Pseudomonadota bacterium]